MRQIKEHRVRSGEQGRNKHQPALNWESARVFLAVARHKSFRAAAIALSQSVNALRTQIGQLEQHLGTMLFTRHVDGVRLTEEGDRVFISAQRMELDAFDLLRAAGRSDSGIEGEVRLSVTEGLGTFWIAPHLHEFRAANPKVLIDLRCQMSAADILRLEADVAVQLQPPIQKDVRVVKLGRMHLMPFAARSYIERHGLPKSPADLVNHKLVIQVGEQLVPLAEYGEQFEGVSQMPVAMRSNVSGSHYWSIATGLGIGLFPTYAVAVGANVVPVDLNIRTHHEIWLVYHPDASRIPRVRKMIDWLIAQFSVQRYPWFGDDFVHPRDFPKSPAGRPPPKLLDVFLPEKQHRKS